MTKTVLLHSSREKHLIHFFKKDTKNLCTLIPSSNEFVALYSLTLFYNLHN